MVGIGSTSRGSGEMSSLGVVGSVTADSVEWRNWSTRTPAPAEDGTPGVGDYLEREMAKVQ